MTDAAAIVPPLVHGKHNMASDAFAALRAARDAAPGGAKAAASGEGPSFADLIDTLNPLQHIPVVAQIYRHLTGDTIGPVARVAGGALYGGPVGLVVSVLDAAVAGETGSDLGEHMIAALTGGGAANQQVAAIAAGDAPETAIAAVAPPAAAHAAPRPPVPRPTAPKTTAMAAPQPNPASGPVPGPLPQLSAEAFNALVNSFADPDAARAANPDLASALAAKGADAGG